MTALNASRASGARQKPLAALIASIFGLASPMAAMAETWTVDSCSDAVAGSIPAKAGTLRFTIANAADNDTIDLSALFCPTGKISIATGEIFVTQPNLTIIGPGEANLDIDGTNLPSGATFQYNSRVFSHTGTGLLTLEQLTISGGHVYHTGPGAEYASKGGCVYSAGSVTLIHSTVTACSTFAGGSSKSGGGVYTLGQLRLKYSTLSGNTASGSTGGRGGGGFGGTGVAAKYSTVDNNSITGPSGVTLQSYKYTIGGGLSSKGPVALQRSTISNNYSSGSFGGIDAFGTVSSAPTNTMAIYSSTISGNRAGKIVGGVYTNAATVKIYNSTIAFNTAGVGKFGDPANFFAPGLALSGEFTDMAVTLQSSLLSNNTYGSSSELDMTVALNGVNDVTFNASPGNNLIRTRLASGVPADTIPFQCPLLGPLQDNGGLTKTHALFSKSPAIDVGNNVKDQTEDQRRSPGDADPFPYPRVSNGVADIGAYEVNQDDIIFNVSFEACPDLS